MFPRCRTIGAVVLALLVVAAGALLVLRRGGADTGGLQPPNASGKPVFSGSPRPVGDLKPEAAGLLDRTSFPPAAALAYVRGFVVDARWRDLQPQSGGSIPEGNAIDRALAMLRRHNQDDPGHPLVLKVRVLAGTSTPQWLKDRDGGPIAVQDPQNGATGTVGHFWTDDFGAAYASLMQVLAARYDTAAEVRDVTISRCSTVYAEPFQRQTSSRTTTANLFAAGFTVEADKRCETAQIDEAASAWRHTRLSLAVNPYQEISPTGAGRMNEAFTEEVMQYCRAHLGAQCVLENNSIRTPPLSGYAQLYAAIRQLGPPIAFQTAASRKVGDLGQTLDWARSQGASSVELPGNYQQHATEARLGEQSDALARAPQG